MEKSSRHIQWHILLLQKIFFFTKSKSLQMLHSSEVLVDSYLASALTVSSWFVTEPKPKPQPPMAFEEQWYMNIHFKQTRGILGLI